MTPGQLIDLLEKAGMLKEESPGVFGWHPTMQKAERFFHMAQAAEREAVCRIVTGLCISDNNAEEINRAIRARGQA